MNDDVVIRYVVDLVDKGSAKALANDREIRKSATQTSDVMQRQARQAIQDADRVISASERTARAYQRTGSTSLSAGRQMREGADVGVRAMAGLGHATETMERRARTSLRQTEGHLRQTHGALRDLARQGAILGTTYLGYQTFKGAIDGTLTLAKETGRLQGITSLNARQASALITITNARGVSTSQLDQAMMKLARSTDAVTKGTGKQHASLAALAGVAGTLTGRQRELADTALHAARGSDTQVKALTALRQSLIGEGAAHRIANAGRQSATLSQAQQYTMTKQQIAAWHDHQKALAANDRVANATFSASAQRQKTAVSDALSAANSTNKQADALKRLGLSQADIARGANDTQFLLGRVAQGIGGIHSAAGRADVMQSIFGRGATKLGPVIADMREQVKLANEYGATLDGKTIKSVDQLEKAELKVKYAHQGLQIAFTQSVQPMLLGLMHGAGDIAKAWSQPGLNINQRMKRTTNALDKLDIGGKIATAIRIGLPVMAAAAAHSVPVIIKAFAQGFAHAGVPGDLLITGWLIKHFGGWGAFKTIGKKAAALFFGEWTTGNLLTRVFGQLPGKGRGGGVLSQAEGLLGATPESAMWVRFAGGIPGGSPFGTAEKTAVGAEVATAAGGDAVAELPGFMRLIPGVGRGLGATDVLAAGGLALGTTAVLNKGLDTLGLGLHKDKLTGLDVGGGAYDPTNKTIHQIAAHSQGYGQIETAIRKIKKALVDLNAEEDKAFRMGASAGVAPGTKDPVAGQFDVRRQALEKYLASLQSQLGATGSAVHSQFSAPVTRALKITEDSFAAMHTVTKGHLSDILLVTRSNMQTIEQLLGSKSKAGKQALAQNFQDAAGEIQQAMNAGKISVRTGLQVIDGLLEKRMSEYGFSGNVKAAARKAVTGNQGGAGAANAGNAATGGYINHAGARGTDQINIRVGAGESVNTIHQQGTINEGLAIAKAATGGRFRFGHLNDVYSNITTRHSDAAAYARGGYVFPFPKSEHFSWARVDQGQDLQGPPGGPVLAIGPGDVTSAHDRFGGFGDRYPLLHLSGGRWAGRTVYYGHAHTTHTGPVTAGERIGVTQTRPNTWTAAPAGWLEFGFWPPGNMRSGAAVAPMLHALASGHMVSGTGGGRHGRFHALPHVSIGLGGTIGSIAQGALNADWTAANQLAHWAFNHGTSTGPVKGGTASLSQLEGAWSKYGPRRMAWIMGQIALAESGGRLNATNVNTNGTIDRGPWQANSSWGKWSTMSMGNLDDAARAAAHIWRAQGLQAWTSDRAFEKYVRGHHPTGPGQFARGGFAWGGWNALGGDYTVNRPTLFGAGEAGPERVSIRPVATIASNHTHPGSGLGAVETWDRYMAQHAAKLVKELTGLGSSGDATRRAKVILQQLPAALAHESFTQLVNTAKSLRTTIDARSRVGTALNRAQQHVTALQHQVAADRHAGASQATIDAASQALKTAQAQVKQLSQSDRALSARQQRLTQALKLVQTAEGTMIDNAAKRAQSIVDHVNDIETRTGRILRRSNIDPSSAQGLGLELRDSSTEMGQLTHARRILNTQIQHARRTGDHQRVSSLLDQRRQLSDTIDETKTTRIERARQKRLAVVQEGSDTAGFNLQIAQSGLAAFDIKHHGDSTMPSVMRQRANALLGTTGLMKAQITADNNQAQVALAAHDMATYRQAVLAAADASNQLAQTQADAADLIKQAAEQEAQTNVDNASFWISKAQGGLTALQISQQLNGTAGTTGGNQQLADYITNQIIPAMQTKLTADQAKLAELQAEPNPDLQAIHQTLLDIQGDTNDIGQAQVDKLNDIKDNTAPLKDFGGASAFDINGQTETDPGWGTGA